MFKEMVYSPDRIQPERIADGEYKGFKYYVLNLGTHPCSYVDVTETKLCGCHYDSINIDCHYGLTYSEPTLATVDKEGWFVGWDYAHYDDYAGYEVKFPLNLRSNGKKWTTEEMVSECKAVIDQILNILKEGANSEQSNGTENNNSTC